MVDLNYNFKCDWLFDLSNNKLSDNKLSDNKLSDNNLTSEYVGNRSFFLPATTEEIVIFMIKIEKLSHIIGTALILEMAPAYDLGSPSPIVAPCRKQ